jgi:8-oxo-dGTP diphosphatase
VSNVVRVTAALIRNDRKLLIARRKPGSAGAGLWEFPGGKIEPGETAEACLERELREEFDIEARVGRLAASGRGVLGAEPFVLLAFEVERWTGEIKLRAHDEIRWVRLEELAGYPLPEADRQVVSRLMRPTP